MAMPLPLPTSMTERHSGLVWLLMALAVVSIATRVLETPALHFVFKPLPLLVAIFMIAARAYLAGARARFNQYLLAALVAYYTAQILIVRYARPVANVVPTTLA